MKTSSISNLVFWLLVVILAVLSALSVFLPMDAPAGMPVQDLPAPKAVVALVTGLGILVIYGGLGQLGLFLWRKLGYPDVWDDKVTLRQRFLRPALAGLACGVVLVLQDLLFGMWSPIGRFSHPAFPLSLLASATAGIGEEILFRLFYISFWVWLVSRVVLRGKGQETVYIVVAILSGVAFAAAHLPSLMFLYGWQSLAQIPVLVLVQIFLLNGLIGVLAALSMRKYGFLAAVGIHFWADVVWHVLYGLV